MISIFFNFTDKSFCRFISANSIASSCVASSSSISRCLRLSSNSCCFLSVSALASSAAISISSSSLLLDSPDEEFELGLLPNAPRLSTGLSSKYCCFWGDSTLTLVTFGFPASVVPCWATWWFVGLLFPSTTICGCSAFSSLAIIIEISCICCKFDFMSFSSVLVGTCTPGDNCADALSSWSLFSWHLHFFTASSPILCLSLRAERIDLLASGLRCLDAWSSIWLSSSSSWLYQSTRGAIFVERSFFRNNASISCSIVTLLRNRASVYLLADRKWGIALFFASDRLSRRHPFHVVISVGPLFKNTLQSLLTIRMPC